MSRLKLTDVQGIGPAAASRLREAGIHTPAHLVEAGPAGIAMVPGFGPTSATKAVAAAQALLSAGAGDAAGPAAEDSNAADEKVLDTPQQKVKSKKREKPRSKSKPKSKSKSKPKSKSKSKSKKRKTKKRKTKSKKSKQGKTKSKKAKKIKSKRKKK